jgi:uncharacterized DUF497 family protein
MEFEWDEAKRRSNIDKHGFDFRDAVDTFDGRPRIDIASLRGEEERVLSVAIVDRRVAGVIWNWRGNDTIRIISVRRARRAEEKQYRLLFS